MRVGLARSSRIPRVPLWAAAVTVGWAAAVLALHAVSDGAPGSSPCHVRRWVGIPCPTCGGTRSVAALLRGDLVAAWLANPLVLAAVVVASALLALRLVAGLRVTLHLGHGERRAAWAVGGALLLADWAWVLARGG